MRSLRALLSNKLTAIRPASKKISDKKNFFLFGLLIFNNSFFAAHAQIFLSPQSSSASRSSASINIDNTRCSSSGGDVPSLSLSVGADPYAVNYFNDFDINDSSQRNSPFLGIVSLNIPLQRTNQNFNCSKLHDLAVKKSKLSSLREMVDEEIITDEQYTKAVQNLYKDVIFDSASQGATNRIEQSINQLKVQKEGAIIIGN